MKCFRCGEITTRFTLDQRYCPDCEREVNRPRTYGIQDLGYLAKFLGTDGYTVTRRGWKNHPSPYYAV
jgi:hypothetical protein